MTDNININDTAVTASVASVSDYYPFGLGMKGRTFSAEDYRYGFNGKEKDDKGGWGQTHYDYGFRIYNPQIARFLSVDPLSGSYPWYTPYQFAGNKPVQAIDIDGLEEKIVIKDGDKTRAVLQAKDYKAIVWGKIKRHYWTVHSGSEKNWKSGYDRYTMGMGGKDRGWYGPGKGTLTVNSSEGNTFNPTETGNGPPQAASFKDAFGMAIDGFDELMINPTDYHSRQFQQTVFNYFGMVGAAFTMGGSKVIPISSRALGFLETKLGKGVFDALGQAMVKGSFEDIDWADVGASAFIKNSYLKDFVKSMVDFSTGETSEKEFKERMAEFGLRVITSKASNQLKNGGGASEYIVDVVNKKIRLETIEQVKGEN